MAKVLLKDIAYARSGDKGDSAIVGVILTRKEVYSWAKDFLTPERIKEYMGTIVKGNVVRYELPNINALNFILNDCLGGGGRVSMLNDAQGKTLAQAVLLMEVDIPDSIARSENG